MSFNVFIYNDCYICESVTTIFGQIANKICFFLG